MAVNDAVDWRADLGGGTTVALVQAGTFRSDAGALFGPVPAASSGTASSPTRSTPSTGSSRRSTASLVETPAGRVLVETGIGERVDDKTRAMRGYEGPAIVPALRAAGFEPGDDRRRGDEPPPLRPRRRAARGRRLAGLPARHDRRPAGRVGDRPRRQPAVVASYVQPELTLVRDWGAEGWADGEREILPGVSVVPTGGHSAGHQAIVVRGAGPGARTLAFFGDLAMRPWSANPRWVTAFDDFPLDSVDRKAELFAQAADGRLAHRPVARAERPRSAASSPTATATATSPADPRLGARPPPRQIRR